MLPRRLSVREELLREGSRYSPGQLHLSVGGLGAEIRAGKLQKMMPGSICWEAEQSREKYGWREMGIR